MNWHYDYPSEKAVHLPTQLTFSIAYDPVTPDRKIKLMGDKPVNLQNVDIDNLIIELGQVIHDKYIQKRMESLLFSQFDGKFAIAARILEQETKKKVSPRTLQAWLMPQGRPSNRRCPEWAVVALEGYADRNVDNLKTMKQYTSEFQTTRKTQLFENHNRIRDQELLRNSESYIAKKETITNKWINTSVSNFPEQLAKLEISVLDQIDSQAQLLDGLMYGLRECETFEDFKRESLELIENSVAFTRQLKDTALDIEERRKEFSSEDGVISEH